MIRVPWAQPLGEVYRDWLLDLASEEAEAGCPRLFRMKSDNAMYFADLTRDWSLQQRGELLRARVKWLFNKNYGHSQSELTESERVAGSHWDYPFYGRKLGMGVAEHREPRKTEQPDDGRARRAAVGSRREVRSRRVASCRVVTCRARWRRPETRAGGSSRPRS